MQSLANTDNAEKSESYLTKSVSQIEKRSLKSSSLENVEIDYIKNLQQQVYFLEIECNYLYPLFTYSVKS